MKSLSLARPLVIMVIGIPGAGKSFFARQFAETFNAPLISYDYLRSQLFPSPVFSKEEDVLITQLVSQQLKELLKTGRTVLLDGGCNSRSERIAVEKLAKSVGYRTLVVWVQTDEPTSMFRATKRSPRRAGDSLNASLPENIFASYIKRFVAPNRLEDFIVISGKHTYSTQAKVVLKKLVGPRDGEEHHATVPNRRAPGSDATPRRHTVTIN